jgi:hypothetical protein
MTPPAPFQPFITVTDEPDGTWYHLDRGPGKAGVTAAWPHMLLQVEPSAIIIGAKLQTPTCACGKTKPGYCPCDNYGAW